MWRLWARAHFRFGTEAVAAQSAGLRLAGGSPAALAGSARWRCCPSDVSRRCGRRMPSSSEPAEVGHCG